jgi:hypothetical protein
MRKALIFMHEFASKTVKSSKWKAEFLRAIVGGYVNGHWPTETG